MASPYVLLAVALVLTFGPGKIEGRITSICLLPKKIGSCDAEIPRYFYNNNAGSCESFTYGGCEGNANNFESLEACQNMCTDICQLPMDVGPCDEVFPRWFHNKHTGQCEQFDYGGCDGNANRFNYQEECEGRCVHPCWQPVKVGPCEAAIVRYYYDRGQGKCKLFNWGGCRENNNNFEVLADCKDMCHDICGQSKKPGPCRAAIPRYYYNQYSKQCEEFFYGGCGRNGNNFYTEAECEDACEPKHSYYND